VSEIQLKNESSAGLFVFCRLNMLTSGTFRSISLPRITPLLADVNGLPPAS